jgi:hypothetical protein
VVKLSRLTKFVLPDQRVKPGKLPAHRPFLQRILDMAYHHLETELHIFSGKLIALDL